MSRPILSVNNIEVIYDHVILVLRGVSPARNRGRAEGPRSGLYLLPPPGGAPGLQGRLYLGRRAADAGDRTGPHGEAQADAARRAVDGPGPDARPGDLRDREPAEPRGRRVAAARRAERDHRAPLRAVRLRHGKRTDRARRRRQDDQRERGYQGVLPGPDRGGTAQVVSRREALPSAETVAVVSAHRRPGAPLRRAPH